MPPFLFAGPLLTSASTIFAHALVKAYVKGDTQQEILDELIGMAKNPTAFFGDKNDTQKIASVADKIARDMKPMFENARDRLTQGGIEQITAAVARIVVRANLGAGLIVEKNLNPDAVREVLFETAKTERGKFSVEEVGFLLPILQELAYRITEIVHTLGGWEREVPRAVLERLDATLKELHALRTDNQTEQEERQFFEEEYRKAVKVELNRLDYIGVRSRNDVHRAQSLVVSYISLDVETYCPSPQKDENLRVDGDSIHQPNDDLLDYFNRSFREQNSPFKSAVVSADEILSKTRRLVVRGDAGAGKTTLLQWLGVQAAMSNSSQGWSDVIPFFIRLRRLENAEFPSVKDFPRLSALNACTPPEENWAVRQMRSGRAALLIDGLDELTEADRDGVLEGLQNLVELYPNARYIISSRPSALNEKSWPAWARWVEDEGFTQVTLRPMEFSQIVKFIENWHEATKDCYRDPEAVRDWPTLPSRLISLLKAQEGLRKLAATPLLCAMICAIHVERKERTPQSRRALYTECVDMLLSDRDDRRQIPAFKDYPDPDKVVRKEFAQAFAYKLMTHDRADMATVEVDNFFNGEIKSQNSSPVDWGGDTPTIRRTVQPSP